MVFGVSVELTEPAYTLKAAGTLRRDSEQYLLHMVPAGSQRLHNWSKLMF